MQREMVMSGSEAKPEAKRKRGRPPQYGDKAVRGAVRQQWHRDKQQAAERDMAKLLLELWEVRPDFWRFSELDERHAEPLEHARKVLSRSKPAK
jgi:hypothetical protein